MNLQPKSASPRPGPAMVAGPGDAAGGIRGDDLSHLAGAAAAERPRGRPGAARRADPLPARLGRGPLRRSHPGALAAAQSGDRRGRAGRRDRPRFPAAEPPPALPRPAAPAAAAAAARRRRGRGAGRERHRRAARPALHLRELRRRAAQRARLRRRQAGRRARRAPRSTRCSSMAASGSARPT